jgi:hypothetical protein
MTGIAKTAVTRALFIAALSLATAGCGETEKEAAAPTPQAAVVTIGFDVSGSTANIKSPSYGDAAIKRVGDAVMGQILGDKFRVVAIGSRTNNRAVQALSLASDRRLRLPAVRTQVEARLTELLAENRQNGGDGSTNILFALENAHPECTPRSEVVIVSDGMEDSESYSVAAALAAGQPVQLPPPSQRYLTGCAIEFIGIGIAAPTVNGQSQETLPNAQLQALIAGWRDYLVAAGVEPDAIRFTSIL